MVQTDAQACFKPQSSYRQLARLAHAQSVSVQARRRRRAHRSSEAPMRRDVGLPARRAAAVAVARVGGLEARRDGRKHRRLHLRQHWTRPRFGVSNTKHASKSAEKAVVSLVRCGSLVERSFFSSGSASRSNRQPRALHGRLRVQLLAASHTCGHVCGPAPPPQFATGHVGPGQQPGSAQLRSMRLAGQKEKRQEASPVHWPISQSLSV